MQQHAEKISSLLQTAGLTLRKWASNHSTFLDTSPRKMQITLHSEYKRKVLTITASIFDPFGLLSPAVIAYKIFLEKLWQNKLQWYELLPTHLQQKWNQLLQTTPNLLQLKFNRKVICPKATNIQIYGMCNSSEKVYEARLFIYSTDNKTSCELCALH
jgi:hypothetical protein